MKTKLTTTTIIGLLALSIPACGTQLKAPAEKPAVIQGIRVDKVAASSIDDFYEATGTIRPRTSTVLSAKIMGTVTSLAAREGDRVSAGQTLIEMDSRVAAAQLQKANAGLRQAQEGVAEAEQAISGAQSAKAAAEASKRLAASTLNRYQTLRDRKSVSPQEFDEVQAKFQVAEAEAERADRTLQMLAARKEQMMAQTDQARADISSAQIFVGYAHVISPISGIVASRQIEVGSTATPGMPLLTIEDTGHYRLEAAVEESQIGSIKLKDGVRVRVDAIGPEDLDGVVAEILPTADPMSRSYTVKIDIRPDAAQGALRSGLYGTARFLRMQRRRALSVPQDAVVERGQLHGVFVVDEAGVARLRLIQTGKILGDRVEVLAGLNEGERLVVGGVSKVSDGSRVQ